MSLFHRTLNAKSVERIGAECFVGTRVEEVSIPNSVCDLCARCFTGCVSLRRATFGSSSLLERVGIDWIFGTGLVQWAVNLPPRFTLSEK